MNLLSSVDNALNNKVTTKYNHRKHHVEAENRSISSQPSFKADIVEYDNGIATTMD